MRVNGEITMVMDMEMNRSVQTQIVVKKLQEPVQKIVLGAQIQMEMVGVI